MTNLFNRVQQISIAALFSTGMVSIYTTQRALAQNPLRECVSQLQAEYGISADRALTECQNNPQVSAQQCLSSAYQVFDRAIGTSFSTKARSESFCNNGGDPVCLVQAFNKYDEEIGTTHSAVEKAESSCS